MQFPAVERYRESSGYTRRRLRTVICLGASIISVLVADPPGEDGSFSYPQKTKLNCSVTFNKVDVAYIWFFFLTGKYDIVPVVQRIEWAQLFPFILIFYYYFLVVVFPGQKKLWMGAKHRLIWGIVQPPKTKTKASSKSKSHIYLLSLFPFMSEAPSIVAMVKKQTQN